MEHHMAACSPAGCRALCRGSISAAQENLISGLIEMSGTAMHDRDNMQVISASASFARSYHAAIPAAHSAAQHANLMQKLAYLAAGLGAMRMDTAHPARALTV